MRPPSRSEWPRPQPGWQPGGCAPHPAGGPGRTPALGARPQSRFQSPPQGPGGALHPVLGCRRRGGGRCCFIGRGEWEASGRSSWEVPGGSGGVSSCHPTRASSGGLPGRPPGSLGPPGQADALALRLVPPAFASRPHPPAAHQASWLWPPSRPWLRLQSPPGKAGEEAKRAQNSGCPRSQVFARAVRDRQACGEFGACEAGGAAGWAGSRQEGELGLPPPPVEPCGDHHSPQPGARRCIRHLLPAPPRRPASTSEVGGVGLGPWLLAVPTLGKGCPAEGRSRQEAGWWSVEPGRNPGCAQPWPPGNSSCHASASPPAPSLAPLVSWPGSGWGRLEEPGIAQPGQGTGRVQGAMFMSLQVLGVLGRGSPSHSFAETGWSHSGGGDLTCLLGQRPLFSHLHLLSGACEAGQGLEPSHS